MKLIFLFFTILIGGMIYIHHSLQDGTVLNYIDTHVEQQGVPQATYYIGQGYYLFQNLQDAATYFIRVAERYPKGPLGDDAYYNYLQCLDDSVSYNRQELAEAYKGYLDKYPNGKHAELVKNKIDNYTTGGR
jgi:TolA-binding protein